MLNAKKASEIIFSFVIYSFDKNIKIVKRMTCWSEFNHIDCLPEFFPQKYYCL